MRGSVGIAMASRPNIEATDPWWVFCDSTEIGGKGASPTRRAYWRSCLAISIILAECARLVAAQRLHAF